MTRVPIPPPIGGLSDAFSFEDQPPGTSTDEQNVRSFDSATGRRRVSPRAGLGRLSSSRLTADGKIQTIASVAFDARSTTFLERATTSAGDLTKWSESLSYGVECDVVVVDFQGNVFAIDGGASIVKFNSAGVQQFSFPLPLVNDSQIVRALTVDDFGLLYVGVSEGGPESEAWLRAYTADDEKNLINLWELRPGAFVEQIALKDDKLFAACNIPSTGRGRVFVYENIGGTSEPTEVQNWYVPYPVNGTAIMPSGELVTVHGPSSTRSFDPRFPDLSAIVDQPHFDPSKLTDWDKRKYCWFRADKITEQFGSEQIKDGDEILEWLDYSGRGRCRLFPDTHPATVGTIKPPRYLASGLAGKPAVRFFEDARLVTEMSLGVGSALNDIQPLLVPNQQSYILFMAVRIDEDDASNARLVVSQTSKTLQPASGPYADYAHFRDLAVFANAEEKSTLDPEEVTFAAGSLAIRGGAQFVRDGETVGTFTMPALASDENDPTDLRSGATYKPAQFNNKNGMAIVTMYVALDDLSASTACYTRVNGVPISKYRGVNFSSSSTPTASQDMGVNTQFFATPSNGHVGRGVFGDRRSSGYTNNVDKGFSGEIYEFLVLRSYTDSSGNIVLGTVPDYNAQASSEPAHNASSDTEVERIERYLAYKFGVAHLLDDGTVASGSNPTWDSEGGHSQYKHAFELSNGPDGTVGPTFFNNILVTEADGIAAKWSAQNGAIRWAYTDSGVGYGVAVDSVGDSYHVGPATDTSVAGSVTVRKLVDEEDDVSSDWTFTVTKSGSSGYSDYVYEHPRLSVDSFDNVWIPANWDSPAVVYSVLGFASDGTQVLSYVLGGSQVARSVAVNPAVPDYSRNPTEIDLPEYVVAGTEIGTSRDTLHQIQLVDTESNNAAPRNIVWVGAGGGDIKTFTGGSVTAVSGGSGAIDVNAPLVSSVVAFNKVYFADGRSYSVYDPKLNTVSEWIATSGGSIPARCQIATFWRGRMVLARGPDDPFNWHMSELGNPDGWDQFPPNSPIATQAISGNNAQIGSVPDIVTALIPYDQERLVFGGDHTVNIMFGDPMDGGVISLVSDSTGIAFGSCWCKDESGALYFFGSRGGVYTMAPGATPIPVKISTMSIDRRLRDVDLSTHTLSMVWDVDEQELRIFQVPYAQSATDVPHFAWEKKTNAWHVDRFSDLSVQPSCSSVLDGDGPDDRVIAVGCVDGFVRFIDRDSSTDDGYTIDSYTTIGPFMSGDGGIRIRDPKITTARDQGVVWVELFAGDTPDVIGDPLASALLRPGQNGRARIGVRGSYAWLRLRSAARGGRWAFESGTIDVHATGRKVAQ